MGITAKSSKAATDNWGMGGFLLVFFPDDDHHETHVPSSSSSPNLPLRRNNSGAAILGKTQSTLLVCALLLFASLLFFTLSTFEPALPTSHRMLSGAPRRDSFAGETALQRMGKLHLRGTRAVPDLLVCHVPEEDTSRDHFRVFLRVLFRSGFTSRADVILLFSSSSKFEGIIREESESFLKLLERYSVEEWRRKKADGLLGFDAGRFLRSGRKEVKEPLWGKKKVTAGFNNDSESTRPSYGSVVSFQASELDPEDSLAGFVDHVPIGLRRWACYPMLLGRVRRNYKHVLLADAKITLFLGDDGKPRNFSSESVHVFRKPEGKSPSKRNSDKAPPHDQVNSAVLMGGAQGVRRLSSYMLIGIVRVAIQQQPRRKSPVAESAVLGQLVGSRQFLKKVNVVESAESIPELGSLEGLDSAWRDSHNYYNVVQRGNNGNRELNSDVMKRICACEIDFSIYKDCQLALPDNR